MFVVSFRGGVLLWFYCRVYTIPCFRLVLYGVMAGYLMNMIFKLSAAVRM